MRQSFKINYFLGFSCHLIDHEQVLFSLDADSLESTQTILTAYRRQCDDLLRNNQTEGSSKATYDILLV